MKTLVAITMLLSQTNNFKCNYFLYYFCYVLTKFILKSTYTGYLTRAGEMDFKVGEGGRGHGTLESVVGHHGWPRRKVFEF